MDAVDLLDVEVVVVVVVAVEVAVLLVSLFAKQLRDGKLSQRFRIRFVPEKIT